MIDFLPVLSSLLILSFLLNLALSWLIYSKNRKARINRSFSFLSFLFSLFALFFFLYYNPFIFSSAFWIKGVYVVVSLIIFVFFDFAYAFPDDEKRNNKILILYTLANVPIFWFLWFSPHYVTQVVNTSHGPETITGWFYIVVSAVLVPFALLPVMQLIKKYRMSSGRSKVQILYVILGAATWAVSGIIFAGIIPIFFHTTQYFALSAVSSLAFVGLSAYVIVKHRFLDIHLVLSRVIAYIVLVIVLGVVYAFLVNFFTDNYFREEVPLRYKFIASIITLIAALSFSRAKELVEGLFENFLYKDKYRIGDVLSKLSRVMALTLEPDDLTGQISQIFNNSLHASKVFFLRFHEKDVSLMHVFPQGAKLYLQEDEISLVASSRQILVRDELEAEKEKEIMGKWDIAVAVPLITGGRSIGMILLGEKASGNIYFTRDIQMLEVLSSELAIAFDNTQRFEEIKQFNETLKREVARETQELREANEHLKELDKLKDDFIGITSHELRTPMTVIRGNLWLILNKHKDIDEETKGRVEDSLAASEHLISLVSDILDISAIEGKRLNINLSKVDIGEIIKEVEEKLSDEIKKGNIEITNEFDKESEVMADPERLSRIVKNLISNAIKFNIEGGKVHVKVEKKDGKIVTSIADTGIGIKEENMPKLFVKFGKLETNFNSKTRGAGIGLFITKKLVDLLQGEISVKSEENKGSVFIFILPAA